ncbi:hypothetical protein CMUS01_16461 [Colletotrichum musicola]|uniref:Uncharacterized protein n=1 Tax=Colletotrichum musicola TaxID=2175873 RepID=A0A8H6INK9_9PEZI|nr:hypothetical protein CMUS01_16461 [Colletotrichum musicola]
MMATSTPLPSQKELATKIGSDLSINCFVLTTKPQKLSSQDEQLLKGLNYEAIVQVPCIRPDWIDLPDYSRLRFQQSHNSDIGDNLQFSLNVAIYNGLVVTDDDWDNKWFHVTGRAHPYVLTFQTGPADDMYEYDVPGLLIIRNNGFTSSVHTNLHCVILH